MKKFLQKFLLFFLLASGITVVLILIETLVLNNKEYFKLSKEKKYLFIGHSHTECAYNDALIDSSFNIGSSGESYFYNYIKLKKILEKNDQKFVLFIEYSNNNIKEEMNNWIWDDEHINDNYKIYSAFSPLNERKFLYSRNFLSSFSCDIKSVINNIKYIITLKNIQIDKKMGGYIDLKRDKTDSLLKAGLPYDKGFERDAPISDLNIFYLKKIFLMAKEKEMKVFLIRSPLHPSYPGLKNESVYQQVLTDFKNEIELLDFKDYPASNSEFGDLEHLNGKGSKNYSKFINNLLQAGLLGYSNKEEIVSEAIRAEQIAKKIMN